MTNDQRVTIKSMTAFGVGEASTPSATYLCEIRTLNSRFIEVSVRMPRSLIALEPDIIKTVKERLTRGKVDLFFDVVHTKPMAQLPSLNSEVLQHHMQLAEQVVKAAKARGLPIEAIRVSDLLRADAVLDTGLQQKTSRMEQVEENRGPMFGALDAALKQVDASRSQEGQALKPAFVAMLEEMEADRKAILDKRDQILGSLEANLLKRLSNILGAWKGTNDATAQDISQERLMIEVGFLLDKADIEEELIRLGTHVNEFRKSLDGEAGSIGRKLDFICQEMHREVNTITNKLVSTDVSQHSLQLKQVIERIRQQVQNIE